VRPEFVSCVLELHYLFKGVSFLILLLSQSELELLTKASILLSCLIGSLYIMHKADLLVLKALDHFGQVAALSHNPLELT
jgi:hypothetical protein